MRLIGPKSDQLGPINIVYLKSPNEKTNSFSTQDWVLSTLMSVARQKAFRYVKRMLPLFRAEVKFCSTNRLFVQRNLLTSLKYPKSVLLKNCGNPVF